MKAEIWCKSDYSKNVKAVKAWEGELPFVPMEGMYLTIHDGWASEFIKFVDYSITDDLIYIEIGPDYTGEYAAKAKEDAHECG